MVLWHFEMLLGKIVDWDYPKVDGTFFCFQQLSPCRHFFFIFLLLKTIRFPCFFPIATFTAITALKPLLAYKRNIKHWWPIGKKKKQFFNRDMKWLADAYITSEYTSLARYESCEKNCWIFRIRLFTDSAIVFN